MVESLGTAKRPLGRLRSVGEGGRLMTAYYRSLHQAAATGSHPIAWCSSVGPTELLTAMGFKLYFPENHAAMLAAKRQACAYTGRAQALGYAPDICGYLRSDIGAYLAGKTALLDIDSTIDAPPRPSILVYSTNQCRDIKEWFTWYADRLNVPCIGIDSPTNVDRVTPEHIAAVSTQLSSLVPVLEQICGMHLDTNKLRETIRLSRETSALWGRILTTGAFHPSPLSFKDALLLMGPAVVLRGTEEANAFYDKTLQELDMRCERGIGAKKNEQYRVYWDGMPIWGELNHLDRLFKRLGMAVVASTYCSSWIFNALDPVVPFDSMARAYTELFIVRSEKAKIRYLTQMAETFRVDGLIFHEAKTCPANSNSRYGLPNRLNRSLALPCLVLFSDHVDTTLFDGDRINNQIEAFIEQMEATRQ
jgi:benzoyl-CoA reductase/2-hydroxyglutaryl-CoA dehydratase subunit BcrC/BadD/HgdB